MRDKQSELIFANLKLGREWIQQASETRRLFFSFAQLVFPFPKQREKKQTATLIYL